MTPLKDTPRGAMRRRTPAGRQCAKTGIRSLRSELDPTSRSAFETPARSAGSLPLTPSPRDTTATANDDIRLTLSPVALNLADQASPPEVGVGTETPERSPARLGPSTSPLRSNRAIDAYREIAKAPLGERVRSEAIRVVA